MAMTKEALTDLPVFDTRKYVRTLTRGDSFTEKQANANADGLQEALRGVATKADIKETKAETQAVKIELKAEIGALRKEVKADIRGLEKRMDVQFQAVDVRFQAMQEQMRGMRQMMIIGFSMNGGLVLLLGLLLGLK